MHAFDSLVTDSDISTCLSLSLDGSFGFSSNMDSFIISLAS